MAATATASHPFSCSFIESGLKWLTPLKDETAGTQFVRQVKDTLGAVLFHPSWSLSAVAYLKFQGKSQAKGGGNFSGSLGGNGLPRQWNAFNSNAKRTSHPTLRLDLDEFRTFF
jgi:hypothetical protein